MNAVEVYRLEDKEGYGPYRFGGEFFKTLILDHGSRNMTTHPAPWYDFGRMPHNYEFFGCDSVESLKDWFGSYWEGLLERGFKVVLYVIPEDDVHHGVSRKQIMCRTDNALKEVISS